MSNFLQNLTDELSNVCTTDYSNKIRDYRVYEGHCIISNQSIMTGSIFEYGSYEEYFEKNPLDSDEKEFAKIQTNQ